MSIETKHARACDKCKMQAEVTSLSEIPAGWTRVTVDLGYASDDVDLCTECSHKAKTEMLIASLSAQSDDEDLPF